MHKNPKKRRKGTKLWVITVRYEGGAPHIYATECLDPHHHAGIKIRALTPRAAARRYVRNALAFNAAARETEYDTGWGLEPPTKEDIKFYGSKDVRRAVIHA